VIGNKGKILWLGNRDSNSQRDASIWIAGKFLVILDWERILRLSYGLAGLFRSLWIALGIDTNLYFSGPAVIAFVVVQAAGFPCRGCRYLDNPIFQP
jgi:hypothetical protein